MQICFNKKKIIPTPNFGTVIYINYLFLQNILQNI